MKIQLLFSTPKGGGDVETLEIADGARLKHVLLYLRQRGDWNGTDRIKVWVNGHPKNEPQRDKEQELHPADLITVELPERWNVD